ncbi:hypothetical protein GCM10027035_18060 [Emticicia sediminis]
MKKLILVLVILSYSALGQVIAPDNRIVVLGEASMEIPADRVVFNITLRFNDSINIQAAYSKHKIAENKLLEFLKTNNIPNKNVSYTLISVGRELEFDEETRKRLLRFGTNQNISVTVEDVKKYAEFMMKLISAGFTEVSTSFTSSQENEFREILITKAIETARKKANVMAKASNRVIYRILKVSDTDESDSEFRYDDVAYAAMAVSNGAGITEIPQSITKKYSVKVVFGLK